MGKLIMKNKIDGQTDGFKVDLFFETKASVNETTQ
jgi:hypothetical protein